MCAWKQNWINMVKIIIMHTVQTNSENNFNNSCDVERLDDVGNDKENYI